MPRIVGTENHRLVREFIVDTLQGLNANWHIELDNFKDRAPHPYGEVKLSLPELILFRRARGLSIFPFFHHKTFRFL